MSFTPTREQLHGLSADTASLYGMPHIGCRYTGRGVRGTAFEDGWTGCASCGSTATNRHHEPPISKSRATDPETGKRLPGVFLLMTGWGRFVLRPALIALCGSGTTGCHGLRHSGKLRIRWRWDSDKHAEKWWEGWFLSHGYVPHDERLYAFGCYVFEQRDDNGAWSSTWTYRGDFDGQR